MTTQFEYDKLLEKIAYIHETNAHIRSGVHELRDGYRHQREQIAEMRSQLLAIRTTEQETDANMAKITALLTDHLRPPSSKGMK